MLLTRSSEYGLELMLYLLKQETDNFIPLNQISAGTKLSYHFLGKISQILVKAGLLKAYRGPNGGVALNRAPNKITLFDIISAIEGTSFLHQCILRPESCSKDNPCQIHEIWIQISKDIQDVFYNITIDTFLNKPEVKIDSTAG